MSDRTGKYNRLERLGYFSNLEMTRDNKGQPIPYASIEAVRAQKVWSCEGAECDLGPIEWDELHIVHAKGTERHWGKVSRYHIACAVMAKIILPIEGGTDSRNQRKQAIRLRQAREAAARRDADSGMQ